MTNLLAFARARKKGRVYAAFLREQARDRSARRQTPFSFSAVRARGRPWSSKFCPATRPSRERQNFPTWRSFAWRLMEQECRDCGESGTREIFQTLEPAAPDRNGRRISRNARGFIENRQTIFYRQGSGELSPRRNISVSSCRTPGSSTYDAIRLPVVLDVQAQLHGDESAAWANLAVSTATTSRSWRTSIASCRDGFTA